MTRLNISNLFKKAEIADKHTPYSNPVEDAVIAKVDGDKEEQQPMWVVTNLPNNQPDVPFFNGTKAFLWALRYKRMHNLSNLKVQSI